MHKEELAFSSVLWANLLSTEQKIITKADRLGGFEQAFIFCCIDNCFKSILYGH